MGGGLGGQRADVYQLDILVRSLCTRTCWAANLIF